LCKVASVNGSEYTLKRERNRWKGARGLKEKKMI